MNKPVSISFMNGEQKDNGLRHIQAPNKTIFNAETYVGNWYEETVQNTIKMKDFINKRECEELSIQKSQVMADILLKPVRLTERRDGYVYFGDSVQLISPGPDCATVLAAHPFKKYCDIGHLALSASVPPTVIDHSPYLNTDSIIAASKHLYPVVRNSFVIERPECPEDNTTILHYGDVFRIRAMPTQHWPLYLHSAPAIPLHAASAHSGNPLVRFSDTKNPNTLWKFMPLDPMENLRMELGIPISLKKRLLLQHALSGNNLSIEPDYPVLTYFDCELEVTVKTKRNRVKKITWANHWVIDTERGWSKPDPAVMAQAKISAAFDADEATKSPLEEAREKERQRNESADAGNDNCKVQFDSSGNLNIVRSGDGGFASTGTCREGLRNSDDYEWKPKQEEKSQQTLEQFEREKLTKEFEKMRMDRSIPGQVLPHDWTTAPQPHAQEYRLSKNDALFPNKKYNCGDTQCCYDRAVAPPPVPDCPPPSKCYDQQFNKM